VGKGGSDFVPDELRAADAQQPGEYRNPMDRAGAGVDVREVIAIIIVVGLVVWFLTTFHP
jgi:hypothetical protein